MKKIICCLLSMILAFAMTTGISADEAAASDGMKSKLSEMTNEECVVFLKKSGVVFPYNEEDSGFWGPIVKDMIVAVEENPNHIFAYSFTKTQALAEMVKSAVNVYYDVRVEDNAISPMNTRVVVGLQHSTLVTPWIIEYLNYNCYGYAIGTHERKDPGHYSNRTLSEILNVAVIADLVVYDLKVLGYADARRWRSGADIDICTGGEIMALRISQGVDYHFMKLNNEDDRWYHKPGTTAVLRYNYEPTVVLNWTNEAVDMDTYYPPTITYNSDIYYIGYDFDHTGYEYEYCGGSRHVLTCTTCGSTSGSPTACIVRNDVCVVCGYDSGGFQIMSHENLGAFARE